MTHTKLTNLPPTISVEEAGAILGLSRPSAYAAANRYLASGEGLPVLQFGRKLRVPTPQLLSLLGIDPRPEAEASGGP